MHAMTTANSGPIPTHPGIGPARVVSYFFALDTDGRIVWPFRYIRTEEGLMPQRWRFGRWVHSTQLQAFMTGQDDQYVAASPQEVDAWIRRHSDAWHPLTHATV